MRKILVATVFLISSLVAGDDYFEDYVRVTHSEPVYEHVTMNKPHRHNSSCYEEYTVSKPRTVYKDQNKIGLDTIIGVASGIAIGNQIGRGNGRTAAKVVGGILGGTVANSLRNYNHVNDYDDDYYHETKRRIICDNRGHKRYKKRVLKGYNNYFVYDGREYVKFSHKAKRKVRVRTTISF